MKRLKSLLLCVILLLPSLGYGLITISRSFDELVDLSDVIIVGEVETIESKWVESNIYSFITFQNIQVLKGDFKGNRYKVRQLGGTVYPYTQKIAGAPNFIENAKYILFIKGNNKIIFPFVGVNQGIYRVIKDQNGNEVVINVDGDPALSSVSPSRLLNGSSVHGQAQPLKDFQQKILNRLGK